MAVISSEETNHDLDHEPEAPENPVESAESALLRNFFSVNLTPRKRQFSEANRRPPGLDTNKRPSLSKPIHSSTAKRTQKQRLRNLFKALRNPLARKYFLKRF